jgi:hypothetical protein
MQCNNYYASSQLSPVQPGLVKVANRQNQERLCNIKPPRLCDTIVVMVISHKFIPTVPWLGDWKKTSGFFKTNQC